MRATDLFKAINNVLMKENRKDCDILITDDYIILLFDDGLSYELDNETFDIIH